MTLGQIYENGSGRLQIDDRELTSGDTLEVLIVDGRDQLPRWEATSVECSGGAYYLTGLLGYSPVGLFGRVD